MKSKLTFMLQFVLGVGLLFVVAPIYAQGYGAPAKPPSGGTGPVTPPPAQEQQPLSDNPFFRKTAPSPSASAAAKATTTKAISAKDKKFLVDAASSGGWEIATGRVAEQKAQSGAAKEIATRMITDHSKTNKELVDLGKKKGLEISTDAVKAQQISGGDYDKRYLDLVVKDHEEESGVFAKEAKSGDDADIRNWAAKTLPSIKQHLAEARAALPKAQ
jgi:putative membrane protein